MTSVPLRVAALLCLVLGGIQTSCEKKAPDDFQRGLNHYRKAENVEAILAWDAHLRKNPSHAEAYLLRGTARNTLGDLPGAIADFDRALELNPQLLRIHRLRGIARAQSGDQDGALEDLDLAIESNPKDIDAYYYRANIRTEMGDLEGAISDYTSALQFDPAATPYSFNRGIAYYLRKDWTRARRDFEAAARGQDPQVYGLLYSFVLQVRLGQGPAAAADLHAALRAMTDPGPGGWFSTIARFLLGDIDETALITAAHKGGMSQARNQLCEAWYFAGMANLAAGREVDAMNCFRRSVGTDRKNYAEHSFATLELEMIEEKAGHIAEAESPRIPRIFRGKVHRVGGTSIMLRDTKTGEVSRFTVPPRIPVTLNGAGVAMERIKPAMDATVTLDANGAAASIDATSRR